MAAKQQKSQKMLAFPAEGRGEAPKTAGEGTEAVRSGYGTESPASPECLMEEVCQRDNLVKALKRVKANKGNPGIDGMRVEDLAGYLREHWPRIREQLLQGAYQPQPVKRVKIPKPGGGERLLGIPTVLDRFIQQAVLQVLQGSWDRTFSGHSYGFRPGRPAHQAVARAQSYIGQGYG
jgi:RNA-directed DNA polymerase